MAVLRSFQTKWFLALGTVLFIGTCSPILGAQANSNSCQGIYRAATGRKSGSLPLWTQIKSQEGKVQYIVSTWTKGAQKYYGVRDFAEKIRLLPLDQQSQWLQAIGQAYRKVPKKDPNPTAPWHIGGRRLLDHALTLIEDYQFKFEQEIQGGATPLESYRKFLTHQSQLFGTVYDFKAVEIVISTLQSELNRLGNDKGSVLKVSISGSFPNGKADLMASDIDLSVSDASLARFSQDWQRRVDEALAEAGISSKLTLAFSTEAPEFYGKINPVVLQVTSTQVQMLVFPPAVSTQAQDQLIARPPMKYVF